MAKKKSTPKSKSRACWLEKLITTIAFVAFIWTLIASFLPNGKLGLIFWLSVVFLLVKLFVSGILGKSFTYFIKKLFKPLGAKIKKWREDHEDDEDDTDDADDTDDTDDGDDDDVDMAALGFSRVETVIDGVTVTLDKPDDALLGNAKDNAWTAISKKKPDGKIVYAVVERPKLVPAKLKADEEVGPLNVVKKKPAAKPVDAADKAMAAKLLAKGCVPADLVKKIADAKALVATGLFTEDEAIAHVTK